MTRYIMGLAVSFAIASYLLTTTHWRYSYIPDQIAFYNDAHYLAFEAQFPNRWQLLREVILNPHGVYDKFPRADSAWKALFMRIFGPTVFGWRISSIFFGLTGAIIFLFLIKRITNSIYLACFAMVLMLFSPPYFAMSHYGYNNIHCVPFMLLPMLLTLCDPYVRKMRVWFFVGLTRGLCFYTFKAGLTYGLWDFIFLFSGIIFQNRSDEFLSRLKTGMMCGGIYLVGLALCVAPTASQPGFNFHFITVGIVGQRHLQHLLNLFVTAIWLPVKYNVSRHGSQGAYWGIAGLLVFAGWFMSLMPNKILNCFGNYFLIPLWKYLLRITVVVTLFAVIAVVISGHVYQTRAFVLIPLFVLAATLFVAPFYQRWPRTVGWICLMLLAWEGVRCLYIQQRSMGGVWEQSRIFCVAERTKLPILYVTGIKVAWWQDLCYGGPSWPKVYGFADRYRTAPTAESLGPGEIKIEDGKPTGICVCDL